MNYEIVDKPEMEWLSFKRKPSSLKVLFDDLPINKSLKFTGDRKSLESKQCTICSVVCLKRYPSLNYKIHTRIIKDNGVDTLFVWKEANHD